MRRTIVASIVALATLPATAGADPGGEAGARELFMRAAEHSGRGELALAARYFRASLALEERASTHFNLAAVLEVRGESIAASRHLARYLALRPAAEDGDDVRRRIAVLSGRSAPSERSARPATTTRATWIAAGAAAVGALVVGGLAYQQWSVFRAAEAADAGPAERRRLEAIADRAGALAVAADVLAASALVATGYGIYLYASEGGDEVRAGVGLTF